MTHRSQNQHQAQDHGCYLEEKSVGSLRRTKMKLQQDGIDVDLTTVIALLTKKAKNTRRDEETTLDTEAEGDTAQIR